MKPTVMVAALTHLAVLGRLPYPVSATAAEKPLPRKGPGSFPSWTSPVRPRSPALGETLGNTEGFFAFGGRPSASLRRRQPTWQRDRGGSPQAEPEETRKFRCPGGARASRVPS